MQSTVDGVTTSYSLDLASGLTQVLADDDGNRYLYGVGRIGEEGADGWQYHHGDALGSVRQLTDANGAVTLAKGYQPYGEVLSSNGDGTTPYGFASEWTDAYSEMLYLRARWYAPPTGRFITRDTWGGDPVVPMSYNFWLYVLANPIILVDPSGHVPCELLPAEDQIACQETNAPDYPEPGDSGWEKIPPRNITWSPTIDPLYWGALGIPRNANRAQYIGQYYNLCGQVSIAAILYNAAHLNISVQYVMKAYESLTDKDLADETDVDDLVDLVNKFRYSLTVHKAGKSGFSDGWRFASGGIGGVGQHRAQEIRNEIESWLNTRKFALATVMINNSGMVGTSYFGGGYDIDHWLVLTGISREFDRDNETWMSYTETGPQNEWKWRWVRVYNPFDNQTEYYPFQYFMDSWHQSGNNMVLVSAKNVSWPDLGLCAFTQATFPP